MGRSLSFGSATCDMVALLRLAFAMAPRRRRLASPQTATRRFIMQKARRHPFPYGHRAATICRYMVSGTFNSPNGGAFHPSVALLVRYRS